MIGWTGIGRYTRELLAQLQHLDKENQYIVLLQRRDWDGWDPTAPNFTKQLADFKPYGIREQIHLPILLTLLRANLFHSPHFNAPSLYLGRRVLTIFDLTLVYYRNIRGQGLKRLLYSIKYWAMRLILRCALRRSRAIITATETVKAELVAFQGTGWRAVTPKKVAVIPLGASVPSAKPEAIDELGAGKEFLLYVGNAYPFKNLARLIEAFRLLKPDFPSLKLVLAGKPDYFFDTLKTLAGGDDDIIFPGFVSDGQLVSLYQQASALVFPSLAEGFGLPPLEAMAQGTPVLSSNASCLPEVLGDAAIYFDPTDVKNMAETIEALLNSPEEQENLRKLGPERVKQFSWRRMAEETLERYKQALK